MQFTYNVLVIDAIKKYIPGREWDAVQKFWHCPMSSLQDAVELYEFMGRKVDKEVKDRAETVKVCIRSLCIGPIHESTPTRHGVCGANPDLHTAISRGITDICDSTADYENFADTYGCRLRMAAGKLLRASN